MRGASENSNFFKILGELALYVYFFKCYCWRQSLSVRIKVIYMLTFLHTVLAFSHTANTLRNLLQLDEDIDFAVSRTDGQFIEIEAELLPAKSLFKRPNVASPLLNRRYIRTREDTTSSFYFMLLSSASEEQSFIIVTESCKE